MSAFGQLNQVPGPGAYQPEKYNRNTKISYTMAKKYDEKPANVNPGPGSYKKKSFIDSQKPQTFSKQPRENTAIVKDQLVTPPPGNYNQKSQLTKLGVIITPARPIADQSDKTRNPGPGTYKQKELKSGTNIIIGGEKRGKEDKERLQIPGPASYGYEKAAAKLMKSDGNAVFGKDERMVEEVKLTPGPGTYKKQSQIGGPAYSMPGKYEKDDDNKVPGPGIYNQQQFKVQLTSPPSYGIGTGPKVAQDLTSTKSVPGPGQYNQKLKQTNIGAKFGNDGRFRYEESKTPGPGSYRLPTMVAPVAKYLLNTNNNNNR